MKKLLSLRLFWYVEKSEFSDGNYHCWSNWITGDHFPIWSGNRGQKELKYSTTFKTAIAQYELED